MGGLGIGGTNPIRVQSMTTTDTMDTLKTVEQSIRMIEAGCELVRITAPSLNDAKNLEAIKKELRKRGYNTPICADIHFTPNAAEHAARVVEKVRVNPGNYADKKKFEELEYTDASYEAELERIRERFTPLVKICKENGTAMRIGTNHGSLSDRILSRYGDTPLGMVESALEFLRICEENNYYEIILSMKASNTQVMVQAYRLLVNKMMESGRNYPLHLGVTEAGDGEDGRIKSAVGIGTLLEDGLGDTIRVSLTEEPEFEIPVAQGLVERYSKEAGGRRQSASNQKSTINDQQYYSPFDHSRRKTNAVGNIGGHNVPRVIADLSKKQKISAASFLPFGYNYSEKLDKWNLGEQACDYIYLGDNEIDLEIPGTLGLIYNYGTWLNLKDKPRTYPLLSKGEYKKSKELSPELNFISVEAGTTIENLDEDNLVLIVESNAANAMQEIRAMFFDLLSKGSDIPVIIKRTYPQLSEDHFRLYAATDAGGPLIDGFGDGILLSAEGQDAAAINSTAFGILQATRSRISKTEYISCPSCGRTLFDLQETTAKIRARTSHLKGVKIGIMGCIVNGPGEMADADYGYVGTGIGKITLYKGREVVKRNISSEVAVDELISLIKEHGDWVDKE